MRRTEAAIQGAPGLNEFRSWRDTMSGRLVGLARWESREAFEAAMPQIVSMGAERREEWTEAPDELLALSEA